MCLLYIIQKALTSTLNLKLLICRFLITRVTLPDPVFWHTVFILKNFLWLL